MPQFDAITPNPKQPKRFQKAKLGSAPALSPEEVTRRRRLMWGIVLGVSAIVLVIWFSSLGSRLGDVGGDNSAWNTLKQKAADLVNVFRKSGDEKIKNIDVNAPTEADIEYLREQVFPNSGAVTGDDVDVPAGSNANANVNGNATSSTSNVNQPANANAR